MKRCRSVTFLLFCLFSLDGHCDVNKWVDDNNQVHYSDQPAPANVKAQPIVPLAPASASASGVVGQKSLAEREAEYRKAKKAKDEAEQQAAKQQEQAQAKTKYCEDARSSLKALENSTRITTYNSKGEPVIMDDAERQKRKEEIQKGISANCH